MATPTATFAKAPEIKLDAPRRSLDSALDGYGSDAPSARKASSGGGLTPVRTSKEYPPSPVVEYGVDPPRPAKEGYEWVWFPGGYWAEREFAPTPASLGQPPPASDGGGRSSWKWRSRSTLKTQSVGTDVEPRTISPRTVITQQQTTVIAAVSDSSRNACLSEQAHVLSLQRTPAQILGYPGRDAEWLSPKHSPYTPALSPPLEASGIQSPRPQSPFPSPSEENGEDYLQKERAKEKRATSGRARTPDVEMSKVQSYLSQSAPSSMDQTRSGSQGDSSKSVRSLFGSFWHRKRSDKSGKSTKSSPSKIMTEQRRPSTPILSGLPPIPATAIPGAAIGSGLSSQSRLGSAPSNRPPSPTYLAGEAIRVRTPPLAEDVGGKLFDKILDLSVLPDWDELSPSPSTRISKATGYMSHKRESRKSRTPKDRKASSHDANSFTFDVPKHSPDSPRCPANPEHRLGGKGVCVYHGRRKSTAQGTSSLSGMSGVQSFSSSVGRSLQEDTSSPG
ncbi:hypothetical protein QBC46DRAFT_345676 [Diplogelasinospora grovesii]|uniref:Uncharacterized protein n=1 Tax=Diplogelasinospora grovesii TaxID=303347 RepID=A0AAN6MZJ1_9PEZI|nr:hypothetical protein QBC46DRAFT_345676 [Diplogelasinospora grovesii]